MLKENIRIFKRYYKIIKTDRNILIPYYIVDFINGILTLIIPIIISKIIDLTTASSYEIAISYCLLLALLYILNNFLSIICSITYITFFKNNYVSIHKKIVNEIYKFDENYQDILSKGKIINSTNMDLINISEMADDFYHTFINIIKITIILVCLLKKNIIITIFIVILDLIYIILSYKMNKKSALYFKEQIKENDNLTGLINQTLSGLKDIKTSNISNKLNKNYDNIRKRWQTAYISKRKYVIIQSQVKNMKKF